jgi:dTDP-4-dehydrorhamnose reductase
VGINSKDKKFLVLGASSYIGRHLYERLGKEKTVGTYHNTPFKGGVKFDVLSMKLSDVIDKPENFSAAVLMLYDTDPESCAADPAKSHALNVVSMKSLVDQLIGWNLPIIFMSTEFVFDGNKGQYVESDSAEPILLYGRQKLEIERYIQNRCDKHAILRLGKVYGQQPDDGTLFTNWINALETSNSIQCANDQKFSPVFVDNVVAAIIACLEKKINGLFHVSGPLGSSRYELLEILINEARKYRQIDIDLVSCSIHSFPLKEKRPLDVTMSPKKFIKATGITPSHPADVCRDIVAKVYS